MINFPVKIKLVAYLIILGSMLSISNFLKTDSTDYKLLYENLLEKFDSIELRDFMRYQCRKRQRVGGEERFKSNAPDSLYRIDGAWFVCMDMNISPMKNQCNVLSFGINTDPSFDLEMSEKFGCNVYSFDPFIEADYFKSIRNSDTKLFNSYVLNAGPKWKFYSLGLSGRDNENIESIYKGSFISLENVLKLTGLENKIIDIFKIDIEGDEKTVFEKINVDYACKYFKQFMFETHKNFKFFELKKFEKCFRMFHRDGRLFKKDFINTPTGTLTEFQNPDGFLLEIKEFKNEVNLAEYLIVNGEFYFININFL